MITDKRYISIVMPVYNEEKYIDNCINSLFKQDYPKECMEWIFVDGMSTDKTKDKLLEYENKYPELIKVMDNPNKTVPYAMNIGIGAAKGDYIIRLDAHADYAPDYFSKCVYYLDTTDADNVGGVAETKSKGFVGNAIAKMLSSKFGVGNSRFRTNGESGYVDTVPFGAFRKEVFEKWGLFDERLSRNEDNEINYRIRKNGGKIYLASDIHLTYYCRDSIKGISTMAFNNGMWNVVAMKMCPGSMGIRHFIPMVFVLSIVILGLMSIAYAPVMYLLAAEIVVYLATDIYFSTQKGEGVKQTLLLITLFPIFHISYGIGSCWGIKKLLTKEFR